MTEHLPLPLKAYVVEKKNTTGQASEILPKGEEGERRGRDGGPEVAGRKRRRAETREPFPRPLFVEATTQRSK